MGIGAGANAVEDGLVFCVDAANKRSYPGTGTTWTDLVGENDGTLTNGPTFSSANGGVIEFDGTNDYISGSLGGSLNSPFTLECFVKFDNITQTNYEYAIMLGLGASNQMMIIGKIGTQHADYHGYMYYHTGSGGTKRTNISLKNNDYNHLVVVSKSSSPYIEVYKDSIKGSLVDTASASISTNGNYNIGRYVGNNWFLNGNSSVNRIYNRALSADEVRQNYNATRGRFK